MCRYTAVSSLDRTELLYQHSRPLHRVLHFCNFFMEMKMHWWNEATWHKGGINSSFVLQFCVVLGVSRLVCFVFGFSSHHFSELVYALADLVHSFDAFISKVKTHCRQGLKNLRCHFIILSFGKGILVMANYNPQITG